MTYKVCQKQYIGKRVDRFKYNGIKERKQKEFPKRWKIKQKSSHKLFLEYGYHGFQEDITIYLTDKTDHFDGIFKVLLFEDPENNINFWIKQ